MTSENQVQIFFFQLNQAQNEARLESDLSYAGMAYLYWTTIPSKRMELAGATAPNKIITFKRLKKPLTWIDFVPAEQSNAICSVLVIWQRQIKVV